MSMEQQMNELRKQLQAEFPGYNVGVGISWYDWCLDDDSPKWHITLGLKITTACKECGNTNKTGSYETYSHDTFESALAKIRSLVNGRDVA